MTTDTEADKKQAESFNERQYQRLITARNFHYENFNKWSLYFYAIIAALFVGYYTLITKEVNDTIDIWAIMILGYIVSMCCYLSGKGYFYWEKNWIMLLHHYERSLLNLGIDSETNTTNQVYSVFADVNDLNKMVSFFDSANISSSKLSLVASFSTTCAWGFLMANTYFANCECCCQAITSISISIIVTYLLGIVGTVCFSSDMSEFEDKGDLKLNHKKK